MGATLCVTGVLAFSVACGILQVSCRWQQRHWQQAAELVLLPESTRLDPKNSSLLPQLCFNESMLHKVGLPISESWPQAAAVALAKQKGVPCQFSFPRVTGAIQYIYILQVLIKPAVYLLLWQEDSAPESGCGVMASINLWQAHRHCAAVFQRFSWVFISGIAPHLSQCSSAFAVRRLHVGQSPARSLAVEHDMTPRLRFAVFRMLRHLKSFMCACVDVMAYHIVLTPF
jgi:hypothetical protein